MNENENVKLSPEEIKAKKAAKFIELAPGRVDNVVNALARLAKLAARGSYEYTPEQIEKIFAEIENAGASALAAFQPKTSDAPKKPGFTF
jgi:hypothetical protein